MILYFCSASYGGIADYAHHQAMALAGLGEEVVLLCPIDFPHAAKHYQVRPELASTQPQGGRWANRFRIARTIFSHTSRLDEVIAELQPKQVLFATYSEYFAPFWAGKFRKWQEKGISFSAVVHDPVRDHVVGPKWWHESSLQSGYSFLSHGFVHEDIELPTPTTIIPHGPFSFPEPTQSPEAVRKHFGIPMGARLLLSFGHLRNNKNLSLILEALPEEAHLLIAGSEAPSGQINSQTYRKQSEHLGISDRVHWDIAHISEASAADYFQASDVVMLTYDATFHSASGVLNVAAHYEKPIIVSSGSGPLQSLMTDYSLGHWCAPDSASAISSALALSMDHVDWSSYLADNSWAENARRVRAALS